MFKGASSLSSYFPADTSVLEKIGDLVANAGKIAGFNTNEISDIQLAVDEACTNTICHGLKHDASKEFQINIRWQPGEIEIRIHETGEPFDPDSVKPPDIKSDINHRTVGGLGLLFIKKLMDEAEYFTGKDGQKTFRMLKRKI